VQLSEMLRIRSTAPIIGASNNTGLGLIVQVQVRGVDGGHSEKSPSSQAVSRGLGTDWRQENETPIIHFFGQIKLFILSILI
jgi:hypothetical protein